MIIFQNIIIISPAQRAVVDLERDLRRVEEGTNRAVEHARVRVFKVVPVPRDDRHSADRNDVRVALLQVPVRYEVARQLFLIINNIN